MFEKLGRQVADHPWRLLLIWMAAAVVLALTAPRWDQYCQDDDIRFLPSRCMSLAGHALLERAFPDDVFASKIIFAFAREAQPLTPPDLALVRQMAQGIQEIRQSQPDLGLGPVTSCDSPLIGSRLISDDHRCTLIVVPVETPFLAAKTAHAVARLETLADTVVGDYRKHEGTASAGLEFATTGPSAIGRDLNQAVLQSLEGTTTATVILVVVILLLVYRSPILALIPLVTIGTSVWLSLRILALMAQAQEFQLTSVTRIFVVVVLYGAGTDYCLFLISRYRENLEQGADPEQAVKCCLRQVGWALTASAGTVICGMAMMGFAEFVKIRCTGPAIALSLLVALAASLTLAPALLRVLGRWAFWPRTVTVAAGPKLYDDNPQVRHAFWEWLGGRIAKRPFTIWAASVALLLPLAWIGYHTEYIYAICAELPRHSEARRGLEIICRHFPPGEVGPLTILLQSKEDWNRPEGQALMAHLTNELERLPHVAEVRSLARPLGRTSDNGANNGAAPGGLRALVPGLVGKLAQRHYLAKLPDGNVARLDLIFRTDPFSVETVRALENVQAHLESALGAWGGEKPRVALYGVTTITHDLAVTHESDRLLVNSLVMGSILIILLALVRRPLFAIYLLLTVLFSYYVTIGAVGLMSMGWLDAKLGEVDWKVPYFLFTILVSVGEDYNIFLLTRVFEEARRFGLRQGTQRALASTGATITSCGLIMAGAFATMVLCPLTTLIQLGMALSFGVLLDTFVVRPILVPAFLLMTTPETATKPAQVTESAQPETRHQRSA